MNRWKSALPWVLAAVLTTACLVTLGVVALDPAPGAAQTAWQALSGRTPTTPDSEWTPSPEETPSESPTESPSPSATPSGEPSAPATRGPFTRPTGSPVPSPSPRASRGPLEVPGRVCVPTPRLTPLRVLTFNIHGGIGHQGRDLPRIVEEIRASGADVVMLQEVDRFRPRTGAVDMPALLAGQLGMQHAFAPNVRYPGRAEYGVATLSRFPIVDVEHVLLPNDPGKEQRGLLRTRVAVADDQVVDVYNTHLDHTSDALRRRQAESVRSLVERGDQPVILGGDFNATINTVPYATLTSSLADSWTHVGDGRGPTAGRNGGARIDYVFLTEAVIAKDAAVLPSAVSDHSGVAVDVDVAGLATCSWVIAPR